ncbi:MAG: HAD family hydrolase [Candidatus Diapherotrites archaeon]|nr:HAD family hydrolase [Candidatus Diapherotrites archaeon]
MAKIKAVIFDWNGVITDDVHLIYESIMHVAKYAKVKRISLQEFKENYALPWPNFYKYLGVKLPIKKCSEQFIEKLISLPGANLFPGVLETLNFLKEKNITMNVLTSHKKFLLEEDISRFNLQSYFVNVYSGVVDKKDKIEQVVLNLHVKPNQILYVGDMVHDIETAKHGKVLSAAFVNGYNTKEVLLKAKPDFVLEKLSDLQKLKIF